MPSYLLIETRDPFESKGFAQRCELASALLGDGATVTLFLLENGVLAARGTARVPELDKLARSGVTVLADEFALRERGIAMSGLASPVKAAQLNVLIETLGAGAKAIWN